MKRYTKFYEETSFPIKFYGKEWSSFTKELFTISVNELLSSMSMGKKLDIKNIMMKNQTKKKMSYVLLTDKAIQTKKFDVFLYNKGSHLSALESLSHELIHVKQIAEGSLDYDGKNLLWKGEKFDPKTYKLDQRKSKDKSKGYWEAPWEEEAYKDQKKYATLLKHSSVFNNFKNKWNPLIQEKTKGKFNFDDIMAADFQEPTLMSQLFDNINYIG